MVKLNFKIFAVLFLLLFFGLKINAQLIRLPYIESQETSYFKLLELNNSKTSLKLTFLVSLTSLKGFGIEKSFTQGIAGSADEIVVIDEDTGKEYKTLNKKPKNTILKANDRVVFILEFEKLPLSVKKITVKQRNADPKKLTQSILYTTGISLVDYTQNTNEENYALLLKKNIYREEFVRMAIDSIAKDPGYKINPNGWFYKIKVQGNGYLPKASEIMNVKFEKMKRYMTVVSTRYRVSSSRFTRARETYTGPWEPDQYWIQTGIRYNYMYFADEISYFFPEGTKVDVFIPLAGLNTSCNRPSIGEVSHYFVEYEVEKFAFIKKQ